VAIAVKRPTYHRQYRERKESLLQAALRFPRRESQLQSFRGQGTGGEGRGDRRQEEKCESGTP